MKKLAVFFLCAVLLFAFSTPAYAIWPFSKPTPTPAPLPEEQVNCLTDCYFFLDSAANKYILLFSLQDSSNEPLSPSCSADVSIRSQTGELLYQSNRSITPNAYKYWPLFIDRSLYCASVQIDANLIKPCTSGTGTISCRVYNDDYFSFDTFTLEALNLPMLDPASLCSLKAPDSPLELNSYSYSGKLDSRILINNIVYRFEPSYIGGDVNLRVTFYGEKTFESSSSSNTHMFRWKLYDSQGSLVEGGNGYISGVSSGDKFRNEYISVYGLPADDYTLELIDYQN